MAPQYKLTYFDLTGLGESVRFLFHYGGISFVDNRIPKDQWPALKLQTPLGQLPLLEVDGRVLYQSTAIARYVATLVGLNGKTPLENWEIDAVVDTVNDLRTKFFGWFAETDEAKKKELAAALENESFPFFLSKLESWAAKNKGYLALGRLTWADIYFTTNLDFLSFAYNNTNLLQGYPTLTKVRQTVVSNPRIKAWIEKRPKDKL